MQANPTTPQPEQEEGLVNKFLTFVLGDEIYGLDIRHVREIIGVQAVTSVPEVPAHIKGVINLRGKVIPVMDVRLRFGLEERPHDDRTCIIVVMVNDWSVGLVVDTVSEVLDIAPANIEPAPKIAGGRQGHFLEGIGMVGDEVRLLMDAQKLVGSEDLAPMMAEA